MFVDKYGTFSQFVDNGRKSFCCPFTPCCIRERDLGVGEPEERRKG
jgi:hypothetical protein